MRREEVMRKIFIRTDYCKGCLICVESCPKKILKISSSISAKGYTLPQVTNTEKCNGCGICEIVCPDFAIAVEKKDKTV
jgi:2-oxoglutarate ferredoxin oxidoreductase subunit delta